MEGVKTQVCIRCREPKPLEEGFHRNRSQSNGYRKECKDCFMRRNYGREDLPEKTLMAIEKRVFENQRIQNELKNSRAFERLRQAREELAPTRIRAGRAEGEHA